MLAFRNEPLVLLLIRPRASACQAQVRETLNKLAGKPIRTSNINTVFRTLQTKGLIQKLHKKKNRIGRRRVHYKLTTKGKSMHCQLRRQAKWLYNLDTRRKE